jgi:hypothetical protein
LGGDAGDIPLLRVPSVGQAPEDDEQDHDGGQDGERDPDAVDGDLGRAAPNIHHGADWVCHQGAVGQSLQHWKLVQNALRSCKQGIQLSKDATASSPSS